MKALSIICFALFVLKPQYLTDIDNIYNYTNPSKEFGTLAVQWAGVVDNGEGSDFIHGLEGSIHIYIYNQNKKCPGEKSRYQKPLRSECLCGLHKKKGCCGYEWYDLDEKNYNNLEIFDWRYENDAVLILIYESDPGPGRKHDPLFCGVVNRYETLYFPKIYYSLRHRVSDNFINKIKKALIFNRLNKINPSLSKKRPKTLYWFEEILWEDKNSVTKIGLEPGIPKMFIKLETINLHRADDLIFLN